MEFNYINPGSAASDAIYDVMLDRQKQKQIEFQNSIVSRREAREEEDVRARHEYEMANLKRQQAKDAEAEIDKQREQLRKEVQSRFIKGDYMNDPELNSRIKKLGMEGEFFDPEAAQPGPPPALGSQLGPPQPGGAIPGMQTPAAPIEPPKPAALRFAGTAAQRQDDVKKQTQMAFLQDASNPEGRFSQLLKTNPAAADAVYTNAMGHPMPASMVTAGQSRPQAFMNPADKEHPLSVIGPDGKLEPTTAIPPNAQIHMLPAGQQSVPADTKEVDPYPPDVKTGNTPDPRTGRTPNAVYNDAIGWALEKTMPSVGLGTSPQARAVRDAVDNKAGAMVRAAGTNYTELRQAYAANKAALARETMVYTQTAAASSAAEGYMSLALEQSKKVGRVDAAILNTFMQSWQEGGKAIVSNPELAEFQVYIYAALREYAKVSTGAAASIQGVTEHGTAAAERLISAAQSPAAFEAALLGMKKDMHEYTGGQLKQINSVSGTVASFLAAISGQEVPASQRPAALPSSLQPKKTDNWQSIYERVYGKKGGGD